MSMTVLSLLGGIALSLVLLGLILREVRVLLKTRVYSPWRGIISREGIAGVLLFVLFRYLQVEVKTFLFAFSASYFVLMAIFTHYCFRRAGNYGRSA